MSAPKVKELSLLDPTILKRAALDSLVKLAPQHVIKNPVMFVVEVGSVLTTFAWVHDLIVRPAHGQPLWFTGFVSLWLWITVIFANLAEAVAEGRGKAQAETLRRAKRETVARRLTQWRPGQLPAEVTEET